MAINGINFRNSSGFVTDGASDTYCLNFSAGDAYPTTRGGRTFGFENTGGTMPGTADRSAGGDARLAGIAYGQNNLGQSAPFRLDITAGTKRTYLALGDASFSQAYTYLELFDNSTSKLVIDKNTSIAANHFWDATGVDRSAANWPSLNVPVDIVFSSTILRFKLAPVASQADSSCIAHLAIEDIVVDLPPSSVAMFDPELRADTWFDTDLVAIGWFDEDLIDAAVPILLPSGALVPTGALARSITRSMTGSENPTGVPSRLNVKPLSGAAGSTGTAIATVTRPLAGLIVPTSLIRVLSSKIPVGQLTPVSVISRATQTFKSGALTPSGVVATLKLTLQSLIGSLVPDGLTRQDVSRSVLAQIIPSSVLSRIINVELSASTAATGSLTMFKAILQSFVRILNPSSVSTQTVSKAPTGQASPSSLLSKAVSQVASGALTGSGLLTAVRSFLLQLAGSVTPLGETPKLSMKSVVSAESPAGETTKAATKPLARSTEPLGVIFTLRQAILSLSSALVPVGTIIRNANYFLGGTVTLNGSISKFVSRALSAVLSLGGSLLNLLLNPQVKLDVASADFAVTQLTASDFSVTRLEINDATVNLISSGDSAL